MKNETSVINKKEEHLKKLAIAKKRKQLQERQNKKKEQKLIELKKKQNQALAGLIVFVIILGLSYFFKGAFVDHTKIFSTLLHEPVQTDTDVDEITYNYKGAQYLIRPVQNYEITGLVVSHNNTAGFGDILHDENSFDTKDLCIIWGENLKSNDFHKVEFWNVSWTCNWKYSHGISFSNKKVSNNHLITTIDSVRDTIKDIRVGDQIKITGNLANYTKFGWGDFWRKSSLSRDDSGNTACEVILVNSIQIIKKGTPFWYSLYRISKYGIVLFMFIFGFCFIKSAHLTALRETKI